eukprot:Mycagemm_TRINITY_DN10370_c2_g2::TRINITY_DN10370_c2_g2_i1::g.1098::m.1098 type:complete len:110 gc:universal TRINITY_DN10370_c2_g2_i1:707-378(-)
MSTAQTSPSANVCSSTLVSGVGFSRITFSASTVSRSIWCESTPCRGCTLNASAIFCTVSVTCELVLPGLSRRHAASAAKCVAWSRSALRPSTATSALLPHTMVCATTAG